MAKPKADKNSRWQQINPIIIAIIGAIAAIVVAIVNGVFSLPPPPPPPSTHTPTATPTVTSTPLPPLEILNPKDGDSIDHKITVLGALNTRLCPSCNIYIVVRPVKPESTTHWHGQTNAATLEEDGKFFLNNVTLGKDIRADNGKQFQIWAVVSPFNLRGGQWSDAQWKQVEKIESTMVTVQRKP